MATTLPTLFVSHGAPTLAIEDSATHRFLAGLARTLPQPRAIVIVSGHWECASPAVLGSLRPATVHDFYGFPDVLYTLQYPAPGAPSVAREVEQLCAAAGIDLINDPERGLDHGAWVPLRLMYPAHDIPVTQLAVCPAEDSDFHWRLGRALAPLREDGVLVLGSGAMTHNLFEYRAWHAGAPLAGEAGYAGEFCDWMATTLATGDTTALVEWHTRAPHARRAHPSDEHFLPLLVAAAAAGPAWAGRRLHHAIEGGVIAMDAYAFDSAGA